MQNKYKLIVIAIVTLAVSWYLSYDIFLTHKETMLKIQSENENIKIISKLTK